MRKYWILILGIPLHYAIMEGQTNAVQALLEGGSDLSVQDLNGDSLLYYFFKKTLCNNV